MKSPKAQSPKDLGASPVAVKIASALDDPDLIFVFPTQIAADTWVKASLDFSGKTCIDLDRFIGWDSFLKSLHKLPSSTELLEADSQSRLLWAYSLIKKEEKRPSLERLVNPDKAPCKSLAWSLAATAPFLQEAASLIRDKMREGNLPPDEGMIRDYEFLWSDYASFLKTQGIYEPGSLPWQAQAQGRSLLFYPSLMPGFSLELFAQAAGLKIEVWEPKQPKNLAATEFSKPEIALKNSGASQYSELSRSFPTPHDSTDYSTQQATLYSQTPLAAPAIQSPLLLSFASIRDELEYVFGVCRNLLDQGVQASDLAISLPSLGADSIAHVRRIARSWGLPLQFRGGKTLSDSPMGKLLRATLQAVGEGFSQRSLKTLFDPSLAAWKEKATSLALLALARRYWIPELSSDPEYMRSLWAKTLGLASEQGNSITTFFNTLRKSCAAISGSRSFSSLRIALHAFIDDLLDETHFSEYTNRTLQRIFEELSSLETWEVRLADSLPSLSPIEVLLTVLEHSRYTPTESLEAVSVYPYHLGIMCAARLHFVLEASLESVAPAIGFLSRTPQEIGALEDEATLTEALFDSMNMVNAVFCHAETSLEGYSVAHPYFFKRSAQRVSINTAAIPSSPESLETKAWLNLDALALPDKLPKLPIEAARGSFMNADEQAQTFPPPLLHSPENRLQQKAETRPTLDPASLLRLKAFNAAPFIKLNPRGLKYLSLCPFRWFLSGIPGLEEEIADPAVLAEGSLMHDMIRSLLSKPQPAFDEEDEDGATSPIPSVPNMDDRIQNAFKLALKKTLNRNGHSLQIALESAYPKIHDRIGRILAYESSLNEEGWLTNDFERVLSLELPELGLRLEGRADRVVFRANSVGFPGSLSRTARDGEVKDSSYHAVEDAAAQYASTSPECLLIDYKRKRCPAKKDFLADDSGRIRDFQINAYAAMLESSGNRVIQALYWSIEDNKPIIVFGSGKQRPDRESFEPERRALRQALTEASHCLRQGRFLKIKPSAQACTDCPFKAMCRIYFSAERS